MIDWHDTDATPETGQPNREQDLPDPPVTAEDRAEALHRMSRRFGQRIKHAGGASRTYLKLLE